MIDSAIGSVLSSVDIDEKWRTDCFFLISRNRRTDYVTPTDEKILAHCYRNRRLAAIMNELQEHEARPSSLGYESPSTILCSCSVSQTFPASPSSCSVFKQRVQPSKTEAFQTENVSSLIFRAS